MADILTIAYVAIGASLALNEGDRHARERVIEHFEGQFNLIGAAVQHADLLDTLAKPLEESGVLTGVFCYDVAEEFGSRYVNRLLADPAATIDVEQLAREVLESACT